VSSISRTALTIAAGFGLFVSLDAALFRSGYYAGRFLEPNSSAGMLQLTLKRERLHQRDWPEPLVLTMGDSRMNYSPKLANEYAARQGYAFRIGHGGVAGTNPRCWYYILRELDPSARRYRAIVFPVDDYDDEDTYIDYRDYPIDIHYLAPLLRWSDIPEYPRSYATPRYMQEAWRGALFKGAALQADLLALLRDPRKRLRDVQEVGDWWPNGSYDYLEDERSVAGLSIDWKTKAATYPPWADESFKQTVQTVLLRGVAPQTGVYGRYRAYWFGKIRNYYAGSGTKLLFVKLPRGPVIRPADWVKKVSSSVREARGFVLGDEHRYEELEKPEFFRDALHMNRAGAARYGEMLMDEVKAKLAL
jgi:hypothetical protein